MGEKVKVKILQIEIEGSDEVVQEGVQLLLTSLNDLLEHPEAIEAPARPAPAGSESEAK